MGNYQNSQLEKGMYGVAGKSFTQVIEGLDASEQYRGTPMEGLDAFERQLKRFDIRVSGRHSDVVGKFFSSTGSSALFPEFVNRAIRAGMEDNNLLGELVATVTKVDVTDYRSITSDPNAGGDGSVLEGAAIPQTEVKTKDNLVEMKKRGRVLVAPYEAIRFQRLDLFTVTLKQIGASIAKSQLKDAIEVLIQGDGNSNPADVLNVQTAGKLVYSDLLKLWAEFDQYEMNTLVASPTSVLKIAALEEFKNPLAGLNFTGSGELATPVGARLVKTGAMSEGMVLGLDKGCALEKVECGEVSVEYDKLIDRQMERAAVTATAGFTKIFKDAVKVLNIG